jgi:F0F1-type ATP synthase delta subunit
MNIHHSTIEQLCAENFVSEYISRGWSADILPILTLISESYGGAVLSDTVHISKKNVTFVHRFIQTIERSQNPFIVMDFVNHAQQLYTNYISCVDVYLITDTPYTQELKDSIGTLCKDICQVPQFSIHEKVSTTHGGGFLVRFRDYQFDAKYLSQLDRLR